MKRNAVTARYWKATDGDARVKCEQEKVQHTMGTLSKSRLKRAVKDNRMSWE